MNRANHFYTYLQAKAMLAELPAMKGTRNGVLMMRRTKIVVLKLMILAFLLHNKRCPILLESCGFEWSRNENKIFGFITAAMLHNSMKELFTTNFRTEQWKKVVLQQRKVITVNCCYMNRVANFRKWPPNSLQLF